MMQDVPVDDGGEGSSNSLPTRPSADQKNHNNSEETPVPLSDRPSSKFEALRDEIYHAQSWEALTAAINKLRESMPLSHTQQHALDRCREYCSSVLQANGEEILFSWIVVSINEWGVPQDRVLMWSRSSFFRCAFDATHGRVHHYVRIVLDEISELHLHPDFDDTVMGIREMEGFNMITHQLDGRRNPIVSAITAITPASKRKPINNKKIYIPVVPTSVAVVVHPCLMSQIIACVCVSIARLNNRTIGLVQLESKDPIPVRLARASSQWADQLKRQTVRFTRKS
eukprot:c8683_g1_i2.p2 GENE.c8683_g1_i2~~c8683_g1_i2.p2  ORF type:complete len:284 (+),score=65.10 c8683_g1_i2:1442-2293(+)